VSNDIASQVNEIRRLLAESVRVKQNLSGALVEGVSQFAKRCAVSLRSGGKVIFFGNGGSAADAQHLAAELVVRLQTERPSLPGFGTHHQFFHSYCGRE